jgi:vanillate O-demethylase monooxygenase subunit
MGNPDSADEEKLLYIDNYDNPSWGNTTADALTCTCNYLYLTDNLLDPSHVAWVHRTSLAAEGTEDAPLSTDTSDEGLIVSRWVYDQDPPAFYAPLLHFDGKCDRLQHYEARYPSIAINKSIFAPAGTGGPDKTYQDNTFISISYNFLTPIDENSTRYHWFQQRNSDPDNSEVSRSIADGLREVFIEDKDILEAVHSGMANRTTRNIDLGLDAGALYFRRKLEKMIAAERDEL